MAAIRKRTWDSRTGKKSAWVVTYTDANRKRRLETFSLLESAEARKEEIIRNTPTSDERFRMAILNFCAGKSYTERMLLIAAILNAFGDLEAAGDNPRAARVLFEAARSLATLA